MIRLPPDVHLFLTSDRELSEVSRLIYFNTLDHSKPSYHTISMADLHDFVETVEYQGQASTAELRIISTQKIYSCIVVDSRVEIFDIQSNSNPVPRVVATSIALDKLSPADRQKWESLYQSRVKEDMIQFITFEGFVAFHHILDTDILSILHHIVRSEDLRLSDYSFSGSIFHDFLLYSFLLSTTPSDELTTIMSEDSDLLGFITNLDRWQYSDITFFDYLSYRARLVLGKSDPRTLWFLPGYFLNRLVRNIYLHRSELEMTTQQYHSMTFRLNYIAEFLSNHSTFRSQILSYQFSGHSFFLYSLEKDPLVSPAQNLTKYSQAFFSIIGAKSISNFLEHEIWVYPELYDLDRTLLTPTIQNFVIDYNRARITKNTPILNLYESLNFYPDKLLNEIRVYLDDNITKGSLTDLDLHQYGLLFLFQTGILEEYTTPDSSKQWINFPSIHFLLDRFSNFTPGFYHHHQIELMALDYISRLIFICLNTGFNADQLFQNDFVEEVRSLQAMVLSRPSTTFLDIIPFSSSLDVMLSLYSLMTSQQFTTSDIETLLTVITTISSDDSYPFALQNDLSKITINILVLFFHELPPESFREITSWLHQHQNYTVWTRTSILTYLLYHYAHSLPHSQDFTDLLVYLKKSDDRDDFDREFLSDLIHEFGSTDDDIEISIDDLKALMNAEISVETPQPPPKIDLLPDDLFPHFKSMDDYLDYLIFHSTYTAINQFAGDLNREDLEELFYQLLNINSYGTNLSEKLPNLTSLRRENDFVVDHVKMDLLKIKLLAQFSPYQAWTDLLTLYRSRDDWTLEELEEISGIGAELQGRFF